MGEIGAGSLFHEKVGPFQAVRIMTGAQIPNGCDAVVMLELTRQYEKNGNNCMEVKRSFKTGDNISFKVKMLVKEQFLQRRDRTLIQVFQLFLLHSVIVKYQLRKACNWTVATRVNYWMSMIHYSQGKSETVMRTYDIVSNSKSGRKSKIFWEV